MTSLTTEDKILHACNQLVVEMGKNTGQIPKPDKMAAFILKCINRTDEEYRKIAAEKLADIERKVLGL